MRIYDAGSHKPFPNFRFRNGADALKAMELIKSRKTVDPELVVWPYKIVGENVVVDKNYVDAPYELCLVEFDPSDNKIVDVKETTK